MKAGTTIWRGEALADSGREFLREVASCWRALPNKGFFAALLVLWLAFFHLLGNSTLGYVHTHSLFGWLAYMTKAGADDAYIKLVPVVVLVLYWLKRRELLQGPNEAWWPAVALVAAGLLIHSAGFIIQETRVCMIGFFVGIYGLTGLAWGRHWLRMSFFPFVLFAFCIPLAAMADTLTFPLRMLVARIVAVVSHIMGIDVIRDGSQLFNAQRTFGYDVAPACSGIRSLISLLALTTIYACVGFRSPWKRLVIALMAIPLAIIGNVLRISLVVVTADAMGQDAGAWVETKLGYLTFFVALGGVLLVGRWFRETAQTQVVAGGVA